MSLPDCFSCFVCCAHGAMVLSSHRPSKAMQCVPSIWLAWAQTRAWRLPEQAVSEAQGLQLYNPVLREQQGLLTCRLVHCRLS